MSWEEKKAILKIRPSQAGKGGREGGANQRENYWTTNQKLKQLDNFIAANTARPSYC